MRKKSQQGMTLLEVLLVLAIAGMLTVMGLRQYYSSKRNADFLDITAKVDLLFQAMRGYYQAECLGTYDATGTLVPGALNPATGGLAINTPFPINITNNLITPGYLINASWKPLNALLTPIASGTTADTYILQFNPFQPGTQGVTINNCAEYPTTEQPGFPSMRECLATSQTTNATNIIVLNWVSQVAVKMPPSATLANANVFKAVLGADCISTFAPSSTTVIAPCGGTVPSSAPFYLVWQRLPSYSSPNATSRLWQSLPLLKQFNLQYTHDQMLELQGHGLQPKYYLCGG